MNILIVDDEYLEIEQLRFLIQRKFPFWNLFEAEDAVMAWKIIEKENIQLAFVDIHLPGEDGLQLSKKIKGKFDHLEVVIVTAHQHFHYAKEAIKIEVLDYLVKPVIENELYGVIDKYISEHQYVIAKSAHVQYAVKRIERDYARKLSLQEIAEEIPVHPSYLSQRFSEEIGSTFQEYLLSYRIHQSKTLLLKHPNWSMTRIAESVGFSSQHHFSNVFKKREGITPSNYKEQSK
ncbi:response regulator transcription factor [Bacillus sp. V33-4]|uniref:response regulator transcription factor n=1 Tax=Bacillus sp. V33-4 TaxID=2054169 RepID=UPI000C794DE3|nr:response regulator [Bacillus sp. V33-4]PLR84353.1 DNA-binding response regulator [Bacillus sp. V33-4]